MTVDREIGKVKPKILGGQHQSIYETLNIEFSEFKLIDSYIQSHKKSSNDGAAGSN